MSRWCRHLARFALACLIALTGCVGVVEGVGPVDDTIAGDASPTGDTDVVSDGDDPALGDDDELPAAEIAVGRTEAESISVSGYQVESNATASGGNLIRLSGETGSAAGAFAGPDGTYDLTIAYYDENDGNAAFALEVAGVQVAAWRADEDLGDSMPSATTRRDHRASGVALSGGDRVVLWGSADGGERARIDCLDVEPVTSVEYRIYYGSLHNHTSYSDGEGTPAQAYAHARQAGLDFFGIADHTPWPGKSAMDATEWEATKVQADAANDDGVFVAFRGFEWSSHDTYGHVTVVNTDELVSADVESTDTFAELMTWLSSQDGVAFLNHPGADDANHTEFDHFAGAPPVQLVGMELFNKSDGFERYYYNDGYFSGDANKGYYDEALSRGWRLGAAGSDDHHHTNWGTSTDFRLAILAPAKTRAELMDALRARRFYSTLDDNLELELWVNESPMGATMEAGVYSAVISASDPDDEAFTEIALFSGGAPRTWQPHTSTAQVTTEVSMATGGYLYVKVTQEDGDEAISSPIVFE